MIMLPLKTERTILGRYPALLASLLFLGLTAACSSDSPTEPQQNPGGGGGGGGGGATAWNITVTTDRPSVQVNSSEAVSINIRVRRADNGQPPPNGATVQVTTTLGDLNSQGSGIQSGVAQLTGGDATVLLFAGPINGNAIVRVQLENSVGSSQVQIVGSATFFLTAVSPTVGDGDGGEVVRITGGGFFEPVRVLFGNAAGEVLEVTGSLIRVRTPSVNLAPGQSQTVSVQVTVGFNTPEAQTDSLANVFTFGEDPIQQMQIFGVTPNSGPNEGGTPVTISGVGFTSPVQVLFGSGSLGSFSGVEAQVRSVTSSQIVVDSPAATGFGVDNRDQQVAVLVRLIDTGESALFNSAFLYGNEIFITAVAPNIGPAGGGQLVTIFGQGFDEPVAVSFAEVAATPISVTGSEIIARTAAVQFSDCNNDIAGPVRVTNIETGAEAEGGNYTYEITDLAPFVTSVNPRGVAQAGGDQITILGGNFGTPLQVLVDGGIATVTSVSESQVVFLMPSFPNSDLEQVDCDDNGDGTIGDRYIESVVTRQIGITVSGSCSLDGDLDVSFNVTPTDTSCRNDVGDPPDPPQPPSAAFNATVNGLTVAFDNTSVNATTYQWNFGDGTTSNATDPIKTYGAAGTYLVRLTAIGPGGSDTTSQNITVP